MQKFNLKFGLFVPNLNFTLRKLYVLQKVSENTFSYKCTALYKTLT